ncbi:MAG: RNA-binding protein [Rhodospirillales bacterium]|nr:RNA-binding protein [Rhodospirillales bacterium]
MPITADAGPAGGDASALPASQRRCLALGLPRERALLIRFVVGPDSTVVPDIDERLPGRGLWVTAERQAIERVLQRKLFARAARHAVQVPDGLPQLIEAALERRCRDLLGLARRAGQGVFGYQKIRERLLDGAAGVLLEAADGASGDCRKLRALAPGAPVVRVLTAAEIGAAVGRDHIVHGFLLSGRLADRFVREAARLAGFRPAAPLPTTQPM